jgi:hypothetical protein
MGQGQVTPFKTEKVATKIVYYEGSDTLDEGDLLCYNRDYNGTDASGTALTSASVSPQRAGRVEKPSTSNINWLAGAVANESAGMTGPGKVVLRVPTARGQECLIRTDQSCTQNTTFLTLVPGQYQAGGLGEGKVIAQAIQTIDRSSTEGPVQAIFRGLSDPLNTSAATTRGPSDIIWSDCPYEDIKKDPFLGFIIEDDFKSYGATGAHNNWVEDVTNGTIAKLAADDHGMTWEDGVVELEKTGADNDAAMLVGGFQTAAAGEFHLDKTADGGRKLWFEARVSVEQIADGDLAIGLCDPEVTDVNLIENDDSQIEENFVGFRVLHADPDGLDCVISAGGTEEVVDDVSQVLVADTAYKVGFVYDPVGDTLKFYIDGTLIATKSSASDDANFPDGVDLSIVFITKAQGAAGSLAVDWVRCVQLNS